MAAVETPARLITGRPKATSGSIATGRSAGALRGVNIRIEPHRKLPLVTFDPLQVLFECLAHGKLTRGAQVDEFHVSVKKHLSPVGSQLGAQKQPRNLELPPGKGHGHAEFDQRNAMLGLLAGFVNGWKVAWVSR
jgi:hypothetical protein